MEENYTTKLLILLRQINQDQGFLFHAFEIKQEGAYLYYNGEKYGPIPGITYSEEQIKQEIVGLIKRII